MRHIVITLCDRSGTVSMFDLNGTLRNSFRTNISRQNWRIENVCCMDRGEYKQNLEYFLIRMNSLCTLEAKLANWPE